MDNHHSFLLEMCRNYLNNVTLNANTAIKSIRCIHWHCTMMQGKRSNNTRYTSTAADSFTFYKSCSQILMYIIKQNINNHSKKTRIQNVSDLFVNVTQEGPSFGQTSVVL